MSGAVRVGAVLADQLDALKPSELIQRRKRDKANQRAAREQQRERDELRRRRFGLDAAAAPARGSENLPQLVERLRLNLRGVATFRAAAHGAQVGTRTRELWEADELEALSSATSCADQLAAWLIEEGKLAT